MKKFVYTMILFTAFSTAAFAQVGIGTINPKATLDITGDQGVLLPRMADHTALIPVDGKIDDNEKGLIVFNTTTNKFMIWVGTAWEAIEATDTTMLSGTLFIGEIGTETSSGGNNGAGGQSTIGFEGDFLSAIKINSCSTTNDACLTVMLPNMGSNKYVVMSSYTSTEPQTTQGLSNIDNMNMTPPIVYDKTPTSFKIFVEEDNAAAHLPYEWIYLSINSSNSK